MTSPGTARDVIQALGLNASAHDPRVSSQFPVVSATVTRVTPDMAVVRLRAQADQPGAVGLLPVSEFYRRNLTEGATFLVQVVEPAEGGRPAVVSTTRPGFPEALLVGISPEVRAGRVRVMGVARVPGVRTKIAVAATEAGLEPIAVCVGRKANRVSYMHAALAGERVDIVGYAADRATYLRRCLEPAKVSRVVIEGGDAVVYAPDHLMSAAVGESGLNSRLAGRLVGVRVTVVPDSQDPDPGAGDVVLAPSSLSEPPLAVEPGAISES